MTIGFRVTTKFNATSTGTGNFVVASAVAPFVTPQNSNAITTHVYEYYAETVGGAQWEYGSGAWTLGSVTLARTTIDTNSDGTTSAVNFATVPQVIIFPAPLPLEPIPTVESGTLMLFQQTAAPTGWTKQTTHNDKALRVVSGAASSGGSNSFSSVMAQTTVGNHSITTPELPVHQHGHSQSGFLELDPAGAGGTYGLTAQDGSFPAGADVVANTANAGSGTAHNHTIAMSIQYVDLIICVKN